MSASISQPIALTPTEFPLLLQEIKDAPELLYYAGSLAGLEAPCISIVGSRKMSSYGEKVLRFLIPALVRSGLTIVSGLAYGVDSFSQHVALEEGGTCIAVLGSGLQRIYPAANQGLARSILEKGGGILTEYPAEEGPQKHYFPARNRIVAGLSPVLLIIEAAENSGTLITARYALDAGRDVAVVPGDIFSPQTVGVHRLLKQGAQVVTSVEDILELYPLSLKNGMTKENRPSLTGLCANLYDVISSEGNTADQLCQQLNLPISRIQSLLSLLELDGYIYVKANRWQKIL